MGDLEEQLNSILSDPKQMEQIAGLARSLMGGEGGTQSAQMPELGELGIDPGMLAKLTRAMWAVLSAAIVTRYARRVRSG